MTQPMHIPPVPTTQFLGAKLEEHVCTQAVAVLVSEMSQIDIPCVSQALAFVGDVHFGLLCNTLGGLGTLPGGIGVIARLFGFAFQPLCDSLLLDRFSPQFRSGQPECAEHQHQ